MSSIPTGAQPFEIGIDEVSWRRQHRYLTLVADHIRGQIVWGTEGNDTARPTGSSKSSASRAPSAIEVISLDMGPGYAKSAREHAPNAIIAIDPYDVVALANRALDEVRRSYWNELRALGDLTPPAGSRTLAGRCSRNPRTSPTTRRKRSDG